MPQVDTFAAWQANYSLLDMPVGEQLTFTVYLPGTVERLFVYTFNLSVNVVDFLAAVFPLL